MSAETPQVAASAHAAAKPPLAVDLDGTLIRTDLLMEGLAAALFQKPFGFLAALLALLVGGRPALKRAIARLGVVDVEALPLREDLVAHLRAEKAAGRPIYLVTASDAGAAQAVADRVGVFDGVMGSERGVNLKGKRKRAALAARFPDGFAYAGDSAADLKVWPGAKGIILAGAKRAVAARARKLGPPIEAVFTNPRGGLRALWKAMRPHQWSKNALLFAPLLLAGLYADAAAIGMAVLGFALVCLAASGTYLLNDLSDLAADRRHPTKHTRPFAAGTAKVSQGLVLAPLLVGGPLAGAIALDLGFAAALGAYLLTTLAYSFGLKRVAMLDVFVLGALYALRLVMGAELVGAPHSPWLLTFALFFFLSLSLAKRHVEVMRLAAEGKARGRGYEAADWPLTLAWGVASCVAAIVILVLYLVEEAFVQDIYRQQGFLWVAPVAITLWTMRIWLLAHRKQLDDDPVAFAVRDRPSWALGALLGLGFVAAVAL